MTKKTKPAVSLCVSEDDRQIIAQALGRYRGNFIHAEDHAEIDRIRDLVNGATPARRVGFLLDTYNIVELIDVDGLQFGIPLLRRGVGGAMYRLKRQAEKAAKAEASRLGAQYVGGILVPYGTKVAAHSLTLAEGNT